MSASRLLEVRLGDQRLYAEVSVSGRYVRATYLDHPEYPEVEVLRLLAPGETADLTGLLEFEPLREAVQAQCEQAISDKRAMGDAGPREEDFS